MSSTFTVGSPAFNKLRLDHIHFIVLLPFMRFPTRLFYGAIGLLGLLALPSWGIDNAEVMSLLGAGISEETILVAVQNATDAQFDTSASALVKLKEAGASETLLQAMLKQASAVEAPVPASAQVASRPAPSASVTVADAEVLPPSVVPSIGGTYYTRFTLKYERSNWPSTNYARGAVLPINSEVEVLGISGKSVNVRILKTDEVLKFENIKKFSQQSMEEFASSLLSAVPTKIELYGTAMANSILQGEMRLGMTKTQVLLARGFPPAHETSSTSLDRWVYWSSRFVKQTVVFQNDRLVEGRGID